MIETLSLSEEFVVVASGTSQAPKAHMSGNYMRIYTIGAAIIEMILQGQLHVNEQGKLEAVRPAYNDAGKQAILDIIRGSRNPRKMKNWISYFLYRSGKAGRIFDLLIQPLFQKEQLRREEYKVLFIFPASRILANVRSKDRVVQGIRAEVLEEGPVSIETSVLVLLLEASKQLKYYFSEYERDEMQTRIKRLQAEQNAEWKVIEQIKKAIQEMESAAATSGVIAATGATTSS